MKILIPAGLFYPSLLGGPANTYYWLAKAFATNGHKVTVVASNNHIVDKSIEFDKWIKLDGIRVRYCTAKSKLPLRIVSHSIKEMKGADAVIIGSLFYLPNLFIASAGLLRGKRVIWSARGELFEIAINKNGKVKRYYFKLLKVLFTKRVQFHATSEDEKKLIKHYFGSSVDVAIIPNYMELPEKVERMSETDKYFLYAGRLNKIKALDKLLQSLSQSESFLNSEYKLLLAGLNQDNYQNVLEEIINKDTRLKERVVFLGNTDKNTLYSLYANAHFLFLVSHSENFGNVVIESLSQGTPVVASYGTPWQKLEEYNAGYWISNEPESISKCVNDILSLSDEEYNKLRQNAEILSKEFDVFENVDKWIEVISK